VIRFDNPDRSVWPGMTATARIITAYKDDVVRVPNSALRFKPTPGLAGHGQGDDDEHGDRSAAAPVRGERRVYIVDGSGQAARVPIRIGIADEAHSELVEGDLAAGTAVIVDLHAGGPRGEGQVGTTPRRRASF
jgi:HlyD family secretion protein